MICAMKMHAYMGRSRVLQSKDPRHATNVNICVLVCNIHGVIMFTTCTDSSKIWVSICNFTQDFAALHMVKLKCIFVHQSVSLNSF